VIELRAEVASQCFKPGDSGWMEAGSRGSGAARIRQHGGGDGSNMQGPAC
jgi:hypothetical protein